MEIVYASLFDMKVPRIYWGEVVRSTTYLVNRIPSKVIEFKTPIWKLHELVPTIHQPGAKGVSLHIIRISKSQKTWPSSCQVCLSWVRRHRKKDVHYQRCVPWEYSFFLNECSLQGGEKLIFEEENTRQYNDKGINKTKT